MKEDQLFTWGWWINVKPSNSLLRTIIGLMTMFSHSPAKAEIPLGPIYVYSETDTSNITNCGLANESAVAAVQSTLRSNGVPLVYSPSAAQSEVYININSIALTGHCVASVDVQFYVYGHAAKPIPPSVVGELELCTHGGILTGPTYDLQERLNIMLIDFTRRCITGAQKHLNQ